MSGANLLYVDLTDAVFSENTTLPDEPFNPPSWMFSKWTRDTDMARFTDPEHPEFWDPCVEFISWTPSYCEDSDE